MVIFSDFDKAILSDRVRSRRFFKLVRTRSFVLSAAALIVFASAAFGQSASVTTKVEIPARPPVEEKPSAVTPEVINSDLREAISIIQQNYGGQKALDYNQLFKVSIDSMLHTLDPHSNYFDAKEFEEFKTDQSSRYYGIGATIGDMSDPNGKVVATYIKATFDGAPANRAGLRYGDKIVSVNGENTLGKPYTDVRNLLRGKKGTVAKLVIERLGTGKRETVEIVRDAVRQPSIRESYMLKPGVGYLKMDGGFTQTTFMEFVADMRSLKAQGMQQLIIDLRDNGGGLVGQAARVAEAFLSDGQTILTQKGRVGTPTQRYDAENPTPDRSPVVILVNRNTASASEILAGAMQDHDRALIVGEATFGKGLVQNPFMVDYGGMLLLTIAKYTTPSGRLIQRDYSNGDLYSYYTDGGSFRNDDEPAKPQGAESHTDTGRAVYSGGGITPDITVKPNMITVARDRVQRGLLSPISAFSFDLIAGKVKGLEGYKIDRPIAFGHDLQARDFPINDELFNAFKTYAGSKYKVKATVADGEREFVQRMIRTELIQAAFGAETSYQVFNEYDNQIAKALDSLPQAKRLSVEAMKARVISSPTEQK